MKYPRRQLSRPNPRRRIIKDDAVFAFNYSPDNLLPIRKSQLRKLHSIFAPLIGKGIPRTAFIQGNIGTGKTILAKRFCKEIEATGRKAGRRIVAEVVNCRYRNTSSEILDRLLISRFGFHAQERGLSAPQMLNILWQKLSEKRIHIVIVLDDADRLFKFVGPNLIYKFTKLNDERGHAYASISVILVSRMDLWEFMDLPMACLFDRRDAVDLPPFTDPKIIAILRDRAKAGLRPGSCDQRLLQYILRASNGNFRTAFYTLISAARQAEVEDMKKINFKHVDEAISVVRHMESLESERLPKLTSAAIF